MKNSFQNKKYLYAHHMVKNLDLILFYLSLELDNMLKIKKAVMIQMRAFPRTEKQAGRHLMSLMHWFHRKYSVIVNNSIKNWRCKSLHSLLSKQLLCTYLRARHISFIVNIDIIYLILSIRKLTWTPKWVSQLLKETKQVNY